MKGTFLIPIAVVAANSKPLLTTGHICLICHMMVKQYAIKSLKYSPKINQKTFSHSDCCSSCQ